MSLWKRWLQQPQRVWLRRALFQVHLWTGLALGLYIVVLSVTGSALVYRRELVAAFRTPLPRSIHPGKGSRSTSCERPLERAYPGHEITELKRIHQPPDRRRSSHIKAERRDEGASVQPLHRRGSWRRIHPRRARRAVDRAAPRRSARRPRRSLLERRRERVRDAPVPDGRRRVVARRAPLAAQPDRQSRAADGAGSHGICTA